VKRGKRRRRITGHCPRSLRIIFGLQWGDDPRFIV
jgi:hypothetical protein